MRLQWRNVTISTILIILFLSVILVELAVFITGPNRKYESDITSVKNTIAQRYENMEAIERHVFRYSTYHGKEDENILWFDKDGNLLMKRDATKDRSEQAIQKAVDKHQLTNGSVSLGYGYKNAVYVVKNKSQVVYYDFDTLKQVYYREGTV